MRDIKTPIGTFLWTVVTGEGKEDLSGKMKYQASLLLTISEAQPVLDAIEAEYKEGATKKVKNPRDSMGYKLCDDKGEIIEGEEPTHVMFTFKTNTTFKTKTGETKDKKVRVYNYKGLEVNLGDKLMANGSTGCVMGILNYYNYQGLNDGVSLYLNNIQLSKFIEYGGGEVEAIEGSFEGFEDDGMGSTVEKEATGEKKDTRAPARL